MSRTAYCCLRAGPIAPQMYGQRLDRPFRAPPRGLSTSANDGWWSPRHLRPGDVNSGSITLPFLKYLRTATIPGTRPGRLDQWLKNARSRLHEHRQQRHQHELLATTPMTAPQPASTKVRTASSRSAT